MFPCFAVILACFGLCMLKTISALDTLYTENGIESTYLPCGDVPENVPRIEWEKYESNGWRKILKFNPNTYGQRPWTKYFYNYTKDKFGISDSINTTLVVKHIDISKTGLFRCRTVGGDVDYSYTTLLQVVGKFNMNVSLSNLI